MEGNKPEGLAGPAKTISAVALGFQRSLAKRLAEQWAEPIRMIRPEDIAVFIKHNYSLALIIKELPYSDTAKRDVLGRILKLDPVVVKDALCHVHPALIPVLDTREGVEWLRMQRSKLGAL